MNFDKNKDYSKIDKEQLHERILKCYDKVDGKYKLKSNLGKPAKKKVAKKPIKPAMKFNSGFIELRKKSEMSNNEKNIASFLFSNGIEYLREYFHPKLHNGKHPLFFDFYLPEYKLMIEFDGWHHYKNDDPDKLIKQKKHDRIKNQFCKRHNYNLLRIPFWECKKIEEMICKKVDELAPVQGDRTFIQS